MSSNTLFCLLHCLGCRFFIILFVLRFYEFSVNILILPASNGHSVEDMYSK